MTLSDRTVSQKNSRFTARRFHYPLAYQQGPDVCADFCSWFSHRGVTVPRFRAAVFPNVINQMASETLCDIYILSLKDKKSRAFGRQRVIFAQNQ